MQEFLEMHDIKSMDAVDSNLRYRAFQDFEMINRYLHRKPDTQHSELLYAVSENEAFNLIVKEHLRFA